MISLPILYKKLSTLKITQTKKNIKVEKKLFEA